MKNNKYYRDAIYLCKKDIAYRKREIDKLTGQIARICAKYSVDDYGYILQIDDWSWCLDDPDRYSDYRRVFLYVDLIEMHEKEMADMLDELEEAEEDRLLAECEYCLFTETNPCKVYTNRRVIVLCD